MSAGMNDVFIKLGAKVKVWQIDDSPSASHSIEATEAWCNPDTGSVTVQDRHVSRADLESWLAETTKKTNQGVKVLVMRLVWVRVDPDRKQGNVSQLTRDILLNAFGLKLAFNYFQSFITGIVALPKDTKKRRQAYAFGYAPKLAAIWSSTHNAPPHRCNTLTQGLVFVREPEHTPKMEDRVSRTLRDTLASDWDPSLLQNPMFPAYLIALLLGVQIDFTQQGITKKVQSLESRTGYHDFATRQEDAATGLKQELSAQASGWATKLASVRRKSRTIEELLGMIEARLTIEEEEMKKGGCDVEEQWLEGINLLRHQVGVLKYRHDMQALDTQYMTKRVEIQIQALFHMIAQDDAFSNYKLSHHMSQTAEFSYRDAASMKTLAVVTMFFLPGSFVSALFSTDLFAWDAVDQRSSDISVPTTPQMTLYWALTIPLTVMTFVLYFLWLWYQKKERKRRFKTEEEMDEVAGKGEGRTAAERRKTFIREASRMSMKS
ncbi:hypothetical protein LIA77_08111 [Sarocladium implicatum]|nr:hypothetical protein LIA77_08111 [Sarocladium implicatum]